MRLYRWILLGMIAFAVGTLFRLGEQTGVGLFRMFGTMGIGLGGAVAAWTLSRWQQESAKADLHQRLSLIPGSKRYKVPPELRHSLLEAEILLERDGSFYLIASTAVPNFRGRRHARRVRSAVVRLAQWGADFDGVELGRVLVLLRRAVREEEQHFAAEHGVVMVNPESVGVESLLWAMQVADASWNVPPGKEAQKFATIR